MGGGALSRGLTLPRRVFPLAGNDRSLCEKFASILRRAASLIDPERGGRDYE